MTGRYSDKTCASRGIAVSQFGAIPPPFFSGPPLPLSGFHCHPLGHRPINIHLSPRPLVSVSTARLPALFTKLKSHFHNYPSSPLSAHYRQNQEAEPLDGPFSTPPSIRSLSPLVQRDSTPCSLRHVATSISLRRSHLKLTTTRCCQASRATPQHPPRPPRSAPLGTVLWDHATSLRI